MTSSASAGKSSGNRSPYRPFDLLPNELLAEILTQNSRSYADDPGSIRYLVPFVLSSVSPRWRAVCIAQPDLWEFMYLPQQRLHYASTREYVKILGSRAGSNLLHCEISTGHYRDTLQADFILRAHQDKFASIKVTASSAFPTCVTTKSLFRSLTDLHVASSTGTRSCMVRLQAPRLKRLKLTEVLVSVPPGEMKTVEYLEIENVRGMSEQRLLVLLASWPNVTTLNMRGCSVHYQFMEEHAFRSMPELVLIELSNVKVADLRGILAMFDLPKLETLLASGIVESKQEWMLDSLGLWDRLPLRPLPSLRTLQMRGETSARFTELYQTIVSLAPKMQGQDVITEI